jgi:N-acetylneuraminic acid mutarotase
MRYRLVLPSLLTLGAFGLAACGEETTQPNTVMEQPTAPQLAVTSNSWLTRRDMPFELFEQAAAVVPNASGQSILYAIGGAKVDSPYPGAPIPMGEVRAYNAATNTWTSKQDMPAARWGMNGTGVIGGKIYVTGGYTKAGWARGATASLFVYDIASNTWTRKRDMPAAGGGGITGVIGGKLYVVTFNFSSPDLSKWFMKFFRYDPATNSWTRLSSPTNAPMLNAGGGVMYDKLYLAGSTVSLQEPPWTGSKSRVLEYDPVTNHWTQKRPWTNPACVELAYDCNVSGPSAIVQARLYVFGRYTADLSHGNGVFIYDPLDDTWASKPLLTTFSYWEEARLRAARVFVNGRPRVEVIGGYRPGNNQQYIP